MVVVIVRFVCWLLLVISTNAFTGQVLLGCKSTVLLEWMALRRMDLSPLDRMIRYGGGDGMVGLKKYRRNLKKKKC